MKIGFSLLCIIGYRPSVLRADGLRYCSFKQPLRGALAYEVNFYVGFPFPLT